MLWQTHIRIANRVLRELGIAESSAEASSLRAGSVEPDKWQDYPHHHGKSETIREYIMRARESFLNEDLPDAYFNLGVALHYVQDSYTSLTSRSERHHKWEQQIEHSRFVDNLHELVEWAFRNREDRMEEYMERLEFLSEEIEGEEDTLELATLPPPGLSIWQGQIWGRPNIDLNFAFRASLLIAKSVLNSRENPKLQAELKHVLAEYEATLAERESSFAKEIVESIRKRDELEGKRKANGILQAFRNFYWVFSLKIHSRRLERKINDYRQQKHLKAVAKRYYSSAETIIAPHKDWYKIDVPQIDIYIVEKKLKI